MFVEGLLCLAFCTIRLFEMQAECVHLLTQCKCPHEVRISTDFQTCHSEEKFRIGQAQGLKTKPI